MSKATILNSDKPFCVDLKRVQFPTIIKAPCPTCGKETTRDFMDHYLDYPMANEKIYVQMVCTANGSADIHEFTVKVVLRIQLELA